MDGKKILNKNLDIKSVNDVYSQLITEKRLDVMRDEFFSESEKNYLRNIIGNMLSDAFVSSGIVDKY